MNKKETKMKGYISDLVENFFYLKKKLAYAEHAMITATTAEEKKAYADEFRSLNEELFPYTFLINVEGRKEINLSDILKILRTVVKR